MLLATDLLKAALVCASSEETRYYPHGVTFHGRADCFAVIMPMRNNGDVTPWNDARAIA